MKRILGIVIVFGLVSALTVMIGIFEAKEIKPGKIEVIDLGKDVKLEMVLIPAGKFVMGSPESEKFRHKVETQHEVTLTKPFYMGIYEVTQEQWEVVMGSNPSDRTKGSKLPTDVLWEDWMSKNPSRMTKGAKLPVTDVSWGDCQEFIEKLNKITNGSYRLPTEAEWEYACRAGGTTAYFFGDSTIISKDANSDFEGAGSPKAVGSYKPNAFGLYDMHGNVKEWCEDWWAQYPSGSVTDPKGPAVGEGWGRILRGGSFNLLFDDPKNARSACRGYGASPNNRISNNGFRLAGTADIKADVAEPIVPKSDPGVVTPATGNILEAPFSETKVKEVEKKVNLENGVSLDLMLIPAGKFVIGSPESGEKSFLFDETQHAVTITKPFYIGKYEITQEQWESVMGNNPSTRTKGGKLPVTDVSWEDCQEFIKKLNAKTDGGYRLPTEAEWEYACRAGTTTAYSFGDKITPKDANINGDRIKAVGSYKPNAFGLYDMHGNVWEWCEDWKGDYGMPGDYSTGAVKDPKGTTTGTYRVLRGGSFVDRESRARSSIRVNGRPTDRSGTDGLRLAKTK